MRIKIAARVEQTTDLGGTLWDGPKGESSLEFRVEATEASISELPWEIICMNLVQSAITKYKQAVAEAENEGE